jgi:rhamnogalacturonan acetylesterase
MKLKHIFIALLLSAAWVHAQKPVLYIIGDSTVKNGSGQGSDSLWGWGSFMGTHFDTLKLDIQNHAIGGRSSRTFINEGRWDAILKTLKKGDFVMVQFGHNDGSPVNDTLRARGTLPGIGNDSVQISNLITRKNETVYSYGHYMRKFVNEAKAKGATAIICSPVPRNNFQQDRTINKDRYAAWANDVATETGAYFIPLNDLIIEAYEKAGPDVVKGYFPKDHTHTGKNGAILNAQLVIKGLKQFKECPLNRYIKK